MSPRINALGCLYITLCSRENSRVVYCTDYVMGELILVNELSYTLRGRIVPVTAAW